VVDKLATFVAKVGRSFEQVTKDRNPGDSPFSFLYHPDGAVCRYYRLRLAHAEAAAGPR
jgi:splicing factor 4